MSEQPTIAQRTEVAYQIFENAHKAGIMPEPEYKKYLADKKVNLKRTDAKDLEDLFAVADFYRVGTEAKDKLAEVVAGGLAMRTQAHDSLDNAHAEIISGLTAKLAKYEDNSFSGRAKRAGKYVSAAAVGAGIVAILMSQCPVKKGYDHVDVYANGKKVSEQVTLDSCADAYTITQGPKDGAYAVNLNRVVPAVQPTAAPTEAPKAKPKAKPQSKPKAKPKEQPKVETPAPKASDDDLGGEQELKGL